MRSLPSPHPAVARLAVEDDGPGIPADLVPRVFTPFARADRDAEDSVGLGLGLAQGLARAMGGELVVGATSEAGTSMVLRLPRLSPRSRPSP